MSLNYDEFYYLFLGRRGDIFILNNLIFFFNKWIIFYYEGF